jgi:hypothetical protein
MPTEQPTTSFLSRERYSIVIEYRKFPLELLCCAPRLYLAPLSLNETVVILDTRQSKMVYKIVLQSMQFDANPYFVFFCSTKIELYLGFGTLKIEHPGGPQRLIRPPKT